MVCADLTKDDVDDTTALPGLLDQVESPVDLFLADGAYDGEPTSDLHAARFGSMMEVTFPPPRNATLSPNAIENPTARDCHIAEIATRGRMARQKATGYNQRSRGETLMGRWKAVIGPKLKARNFENQKTEAKIGFRVLNRMTGPGRPRFERTA
ncbi:transposase [Epibacterium ulvae]|uniref:transposase n=1 Tax=Epibacterium ulvae TaxID=1156985 RepID=UPI0033422A15